MHFFHLNEMERESVSDSKPSFCQDDKTDVSHSSCLRLALSFCFRISGSYQVPRHVRGPWLFIICAQEPGPPIVLSADPFGFMLSAASEPLLGTGNLLSLGTLCLESVYFSDPPFCGLAGSPPVLPGSRPQVPVVPDLVGLSLPAPA